MCEKEYYYYGNSEFMSGLGVIYTEFTVRATRPNDSKQITQINRFCVYEAFKKLGWLYVPYMPEQPGPHPDVKTSIAILTAKLGSTNDDKKMFGKNL